VRVEDDLRRLEAADYEACSDYVVDRLAGAGLADAVLQFGSVGHPGISDLDLLVVCRRDAPADRAAILEIASSAPHADYLFFHAPICALPDDLPYLRLFHSVEDLRPLYGEIDPRVEEHAFGWVQELAWTSYFYRLLLDARASDRGSLRLLLLLA
jgi:hypothetical protein